MNIFNLSDKEFDKKLKEMFSNVSKEKLLEDLIECGLEIKNEKES